MRKRQEPTESVRVGRSYLQAAKAVRAKTGGSIRFIMESAMRPALLPDGEVPSTKKSRRK